jgi:hypothetical protein
VVRGRLDDVDVAERERLEELLGHFLGNEFGVIGNRAGTGGGLLDGGGLNVLGLSGSGLLSFELRSGSVSLLSALLGGHESTGLHGSEGSSGGGGAGEKGLENASRNHIYYKL